MARIQGYPPVENSLPRPVFSEAPIDINASICIEDSAYRELVAKAAALDILTADIKAKIDYGYQYNLINDEIVLAVTGMGRYKRKIEAERKEEKADGEN